MGLLNYGGGLFKRELIGWLGYRRRSSSLESRTHKAGSLLESRAYWRAGCIRERMIVGLRDGGLSERGLFHGSVVFLLFSSLHYIQMCVATLELMINCETVLAVARL